MAISAERSQYDNVATHYNDYASLPVGMIETELVSTGLGDCTGLRVIDIGGGSGIYARKAIELGAVVVDVVDISSEMMGIGASTEANLDRQGKVNYHLADATKAIDHLGLRKGSYDLVVANWLFDHATGMDDLEGMWRNISEYAKPGARFLGSRVARLDDEAWEDGKFGIIIQDPRRIPGGVVCRTVCTTEPPFDFESTTMDESCSGSTKMHEKYGFENVSHVDPAATTVVKRDPKFWEHFVEDPFFLVVTATKRR